MERVSVRLHAHRRSLYASENVMKHTIDTKSAAPAEPRPAVIPLRKTCAAAGPGLSHYVLKVKQAKR